MLHVCQIIYEYICPNSRGTCWGNKIHEPYEFVLQVPQSVQMLPAGATFTGERCVGFGVYVETGNFYMSIKACQLLVQPNLPRNTSWILIWCSCSCEPLVLPRHDLNVTLNVLIEAVTRHLLWWTKNCLWVMSPHEPWHIWKFNELIRTDHLLHPMTP